MSHRERDSISSSSKSRSRSRSSSYESSPRDRDYRHHSRSRSRSRERSRYDRKRSAQRRRERSRSPFSRRRSPVDAKPSNKVILTSLPNYADKDVLNILLARQGYHPIDIRVVRRNTDSGSLRVFGFVEFSEVSTAESWIAFNHGFLRMDDGFQVRLEYSREESARERQPYNPLASDWTCAKCTINNFNRRVSCFKCGTSRQESDAMEAKGYAMVGVSPSDTLLIRELPVTVTEESIRACIRKYTPLTVQRILISSSKLYAFMQMKSADEAGYILQTFNKTVPYIDNCAVIITYSRQSLNQILIMENVNILKSQSGISSTSINEDPTNSAAQLAHNAIQIAQMGRAPSDTTAAAPPPVSTFEVPARHCVSTPFGYLPTYDAPNPKTFQFEASSGYLYDNATSFYYDPKTHYYYNSNTNHWMFWSSRYSVYIDCQGGDLELKNKLQEEEREAHKSSQPGVLLNAPVVSSRDKTDKEKKMRPSSRDNSFGGEKLENENPEEYTNKKKRKLVEEDESKAAKTPLEIQKEMAKWARRQEKIKMSFKQQQQPSSAKSMELNAANRNLGGDRKETTLVEQIKKPWEDDDDDDESNAAVPSDALMPGRMRGVTHRQARVRMARAELNAGLASGGGGGGDSLQQLDRGNDLHQQPPPTPPAPLVGGNNVSNSNAVAPEMVEEKSTSSSPPFAFDETKFIDRVKKSCLLCRRQFDNADMLDKHVQMSALHKKNREIQAEKAAKAIAANEQQLYRDRAKERREQYGYDPGLVEKEAAETSSIEVTQAVAAYKAAKPLDETNVGNRMLKSMGWSEGHGLGRNLQGIVQPIQAEQHVQGVGLGSSGSKIDVNASWKDRNRRAAIQRFRDLHQD